MTLSSEVQDATLRRLRSVLVTGRDAAEQDRSGALPRSAWDPKALAKRVVRRGIAWYVDATARAAAREATDALYQRISMELLGSGSQGDPRVLAVNQELMKGELRSIQHALDDLGHAIARIPQGRARQLAGRELRESMRATVAPDTERYVEMLRGQDPVLEIAADARQDDAIQALRDATPASLGAVVCVHVVERLELDPLLELLELAATRLRAGGVFVAETPNPGSLAVLSTSAAHDPTHTRLLHPSVLAFLCERAGFDTVELRYFAPSLGDALPLVTADDAPQWVDQINASLTKLNDVLFGPQEYAVVARVGSV